MKRYALPASLGLLHGINDAVAGCLLAMYAGSAPSTTTVILAFLGYSLLAFGGQLPVGWWMDKRQRSAPGLFTAIFLLIFCLLLSYWSLPVAIIFSGVASAFVHVSGGTLSFLHDPRHTLGTGLFTAPGVLGLVLGGIAGHAGMGQYLFVLIPLLIVLGYYFRRTKLPEYVSLNTGGGPLLEAHDYFMLVLLLAITMRSLVWNVFYMLAEKQSWSWVLAIGVSACAGKLIGGYVADRRNWKVFTFSALILSAVLLTLGKGQLPFVCTGISLLQSVVPVTLWVMQQYLYRQPAAATALCLGTAIILAGLPTYLETYRRISWDNNTLTATFVVLLLINGFWLSATRRRV